MESTGTARRVSRTDSEELQHQMNVRASRVYFRRTFTAKLARQAVVALVEKEGRSVFEQVHPDTVVDWISQVAVGVAGVVIAKEEEEMPTLPEVDVKPRAGSH